MAWQGYMVGTVLYFAIVYSLPISMGLAAVALDLPVSQHVEFMCQLPCCALFQAAGLLPAPHCFSLQAGCLPHTAVFVHHLPRQLYRMWMHKLQ